MTPEPTRAAEPVAAAIELLLPSTPLHAGALTIVEVKQPVASPSIGLASVVVTGKSTSGATVASLATTADDSGAAVVTLRFPSSGDWTLQASAVAAGHIVSSNMVAASVGSRTSALLLQADPATTAFGEHVTATVSLTLDGTAAVGVPVLIFDSANMASPLVEVMTDSNGNAIASLSLPMGRHVLIARVNPTSTYLSTTSNSVSVQVIPTLLTMQRLTPYSFVSERLTRIHIRLGTLRADLPTSKVALRIRARAVGTSNWYTIAHVVTDSSGTASFTYMPWRPTILEVTTDFGGNQPPFGFTRVIHARPLIRPVSFAAVDPVPTVLYPIAPPAIGRGANVKVSYIPPAVQASMIGNTWSPGCVPLSKLRYITANYWGFDGFRYRGNMVVAASVAGKMRRVLAGLYSMRYQIRSMWVEDRYGRNPFGPGANDYLSMAADNTSAFNCRYIVGKERQHIWSPHASGKAVDINTWENPYRSSMGAFPNSWWLPRSRHNKAVLREFSPATRLLGHYKFRWGGFYGDFQHFQQ